MTKRNAIELATFDLLTDTSITDEERGHRLNDLLAQVTAALDGEPTPEVQ